MRIACAEFVQATSTFSLFVTDLKDFEAYYRAEQISLYKQAA